MTSLKSLLLALALMAAVSIANGQQTPIQKIQKAADEAKIASARETQIIWQNQPPISYEWGVVLGFGLGVLFAVTAQYADKKRQSRPTVEYPPA